MKKKQPVWIKLCAVLAVIAVAAVAGYFAVFYQADVLKIENGKVSGAKSTWLIAHDGTAYYKLADVNVPKNYTAVKNAPDTDDDPITTFFLYQDKDAEKQPGALLVFGQAASRIPDLNQGEETEINGQKGVLLFRDSEEGRTALFYMQSPYDDLRIVVQATLPGGASDEDLKALITVMADKVTPGKQLSAIAADFKLNFLDDDRWQYLWNGLGVTLSITLGAVTLGIVIGVLVAMVRSTWDQTNETMRKGPGRTVLYLLNGFCKIYLTVIRGTPVVIQLMIAYYIILASSRNGVMVATLSFGINSGAYVAEIIRGGIMSIDKGQMEAGRSLGFDYIKTMWYVIIPQTMKNVLPALANEFIVLLKETSVSGYVAVKDLTKGGDIIRGVTYSAFMPLLAVAAIYLVMVMFFTWLVGKLERRLRSSDH